MDVATRFPHRPRGDSYVGREDVTPPDTSGSGGESETNYIRRKFQRTAMPPTVNAAPDDSVFRKPSIPASATRAAMGLGPDRKPSLNPQYKRRSMLQRENVRVPSGPRELPSPGKPRNVSMASNAPAVSDSTNSTNSTRPFLPQSNSDNFFYDPEMAGSHSNLAFASPAQSGNDSSATTTPLSERGNDFLPNLNFDEFQTTIRDINGGGDSSKARPSMNDFLSADRRPSLKDQANDTTRTNGTGGRVVSQSQQLQQNEELGRTPSLRQRLAAGRQLSGQAPNAREAAVLPREDSLRTRRQSSISTSTSTLGPPQPSAAAKQPRKSVGPGMITSLMKGGSGQQTQSSTLEPENSLRSALARNTSLNKGSRRTTIQPSALPGAELPRTSTLTATTQSRQNKVKSLSAAPREPVESNGLSPGAKSSSKDKANRAHTPSSSGNRRQSMASGRASGLGARTISPTDARRLKRISTVNPPPMPSMNHYHNKSAQPTPQEEIPNPLSNASTSRLPELPRMAQQSPSMIPRKASNATLNSTRASSPEGKPGGGVSLGSKSSFSSLSSMNVNGSNSRLPTPKPRSGAQSGSAMGQYREHFSDALERFSSYGSAEESVPPVPAIPKAYGSPRDMETASPFFSSSLKSSFSDSLAERELDTTAVPVPWTSQTPRSSLDAPAETPKKRFEVASQRTSALPNGANIVPPPSAPPKPVAPYATPNGRTNANLQPLRLPPLNLMPINTRNLQNTGTTAPRPSQEVDSRDNFTTSQTPEPKRNTKTPSTPMTASKATFFRRQEDANKALRSSSSHYALRDMIAMESENNAYSKMWDDSDPDSAGVPIPHTNGAKARNTITPFSSGSLPKGSGEYARQRAKQGNEYGEDDADYQQLQNELPKSQRPTVRMTRGSTVTSLKGSVGAETPMSLESPPVEQAPQPDTKKESEKKEPSGIRRKLSMGWRRSSSKAADHAENKSSPQIGTNSSEKEKDRKVLQKQMTPDMPPPKLPASSSGMWSSDVPSLPNSARPSLDAYAKTKSHLPSSVSTTSLAAGTDAESMTTAAPKTKSQHAEQPIPVIAPPNTRSSSWGNLGTAFRFNSNKPAAANNKHKQTPSTFSALTKDKDDLIADDEMARLSRKRKDVDSVARDGEELRRRAVARSPVTADHVLHDRSLTGGSTLNVFERGEIVDYEKDGIYFTGSKAAKKIVGSLEPQTVGVSSSSNKDAGSGSTNFGYDDERGDYNVVLGDHLSYRYEVVDVLGKGSFGQVVRCVDHKEGGVVAVKIIRNKKRFHQQALVEVGILGKLKEWDPDGAYATLSITSSFYFRSHLCIVTPCLSINLYELIRAHNFTGFPLPLIRRFARQLLACLTLLQTKHIIHCDLKPENILLCEARKGDVRVIDFGSSCREEEKVYTYIQSRFYRSPEVILGSSYGLGIDMWSLGCILAELWTGYPIFPGENEQEQLACIMEIFGPPDRHLVERCTRKKLFFDSVGKPRVTVSSKGRRRRPSSKTLQQALKTEDEAFIDFITRCLRWDPDRRLKPHEAVTHPFVTNLPFNQRPGIPDEARRAARVRSTAAVPANGPTIASSPVKRNAVSSGNAFAQQAATQTTTPAKDRGRITLPETPQTAVRNGVQASTASNIAQGSPIKSAPNPNRRHSTITTAGQAAMAGSKRASNGAVVGPMAGAAGVASLQSRNTSGNLAQLAAAQSMGVASTAGQTSGSRWRS